MSSENVYKITKNTNRNIIALNSLTIAMKAYFSTYQAVSSNFDEIQEKDSECLNNGVYFEKYTETIVHFQHFFELIVKDILITYEKPTFLGLIKKIKEFIKENEGEKYTCLLENTEVMKKSSEDQAIVLEINAIRNKIWHQGDCIIRYKTLDKFIGAEVLPLVKSLLNDLKEDGKKYRVRDMGLIDVFQEQDGYIHVNKDIDIVEQIIKEAQKEDTDYKILAVLKELGRASYDLGRNVGFGKLIKQGRENRVEKAVNYLSSDFFEVSSCPCCAIESLISYKVMRDSEEYVSGKYIIKSNLEQQKCINCGFNVQYSVADNLKSIIKNLSS